MVERPPVLPPHSTDRDAAIEAAVDELDATPRQRVSLKVLGKYLLRRIQGQLVSVRRSDLRRITLELLPGGDGIRATVSNLPKHSIVAGKRSQHAASAIAKLTWMSASRNSPVRAVWTFSVEETEFSVTARLDS